MIVLPGTKVFCPSPDKNQKAPRERAFYGGERAADSGAGNPPQRTAWVAPILAMQRACHVEMMRPRPQADRQIAQVPQAPQIPQLSQVPHVPQVPLVQLVPQVPQVPQVRQIRLFSQVEPASTPSISPTWQP